MSSSPPPPSTDPVTDPVTDQITDPFSPESDLSPSKLVKLLEESAQQFVSTPSTPSPSQIDLSPKVTAILMKLFPKSQSLFEQTSFNIVSVLNQHFPSESSLQNLNEFITNLEHAAKSLDNDMLRSVQEQRFAGKTATEDMQSITQVIQDLVSQVKEIESKSAQSDEMVQSICKNIRSLDAARKNLKDSILALEYLKKLSYLTPQLPRLLHNGQWRDIYPRLRDSNKFIKFLKQYPKTPDLDDLMQQLEAIKSDLKLVISDKLPWMKNGQRISANPAQQLASEIDDDIHYLTNLVEPISKSFQEKVVSTFGDFMLSQYNNLFSPQDGVGGDLSMISKRFQYFRALSLGFYRDFGPRKPKATEEEATLFRPGVEPMHTRPNSMIPSSAPNANTNTNSAVTLPPVFPNHWHVDEFLCQRFCVYTKGHLIQLLENTQESVDPNLLLTALRETKKFENEASFWFEKRYKTIFDKSNSSNRPPPEKYSLGLVRPGIISSCFKSSMSKYIDMEDKKLVSQFNDIISKEDWGMSSKSSLDVFESSIHVIKMVQSSLQRCEELTDAYTLAKVFRLYQKLFKAYSDILKTKVVSSKKYAGIEDPLTGHGKPSSLLDDFLSSKGLVTAARALFTSESSTVSDGSKGVKGSKGFKTTFTPTEANIKSLVPEVSIGKMTAAEEKRMVTVVNTCHYLISLLDTLTQRVKKLIQSNRKPSEEDDDDVFDLDITPERTKLRTTLSSAITGLVGGFIYRLETILSKVSEINWNFDLGDEQLSDNSPHLAEIEALFVKEGHCTLEDIHSDYLTFFLNKYSRAVASRILACILRIKNLSTAGIQIWLLDLSKIKDFILNLVHVAGALRSDIPDARNKDGSLNKMPSPSCVDKGVFNKMISKQFNLPVMILQSLMSDNQFLVESLFRYLGDVEPIFLWICLRMKNIPKNEQPAKWSQFWKKKAALGSLKHRKLPIPSPSRKV